MDARQVERPVSEVEMTKTESLDEKIKRAISDIDRVEELNRRSAMILDKLYYKLKKPTPKCEGICPTCGQVWDVK